MKRKSNFLSTSTFVCHFEEQFNFKTSRILIFELKNNRNVGN